MRGGARRVRGRARPPAALGDSRRCVALRSGLVTLSPAALHICPRGNISRPESTRTSIVLVVPGRNPPCRNQCISCRENKSLDGPITPTIFILRRSAARRIATNHGSARHAANLQLLASRLLLVDAMSLHSKKILTIGFRIAQTVDFIQGGALQCPKHRRDCGVKP